jgi:glyoxylase-like metal-dependent hydrolase (beta-lactamase superfamily II)
VRFWQITDTIAAIDHGLLNSPGIGASYVVRGESIAIVETGTSLTVPHTLAGLAALGIRPDEVSHILCTHVHMDHAGGAGELARSLQRARVAIHSLSAPHLVDPSKLVPSSRRAVGEVLWPYQGSITPLDPARLMPAEELRLDLGRGVVLEALPAPGHSPDHLAFLERASGSLFTGDALGANFTTFGVRLPVTVPPQFDLEAQRATFDRLHALGAERFLVTHFGEERDTEAMWQELREKTELCARVAEEAVARGDEPDAMELSRSYLPAPAHLNSAQRDVVVYWGKMTFDGLLRYFRKRLPA